MKEINEMPEQRVKVDKPNCDERKLIIEWQVIRFNAKFDWNTSFSYRLISSLVHIYKILFSSTRCKLKILRDKF